MYVLSVQYSCAVVSVFLLGGKANLVLLTLFYSTLLALTDSQTDSRRNDITRFAWAGGTCPREAWAGGTFFPVVLLCQFWFWREIGFGCTYYYVLRVPYSCGVVLVFLVLAGNSFWYYVRTQCTIQLCGCVIFFVVAGKLILYEYLTVTIVSQKYQELSL